MLILAKAPNIIPFSEFSLTLLKSVLTLVLTRPPCIPRLIGEANWANNADENKQITATNNNFFIV